ncbi:putative RNA-directed DNA polymerase, eukaryota, reverse transcriptase zinc-binding domain protein [Tanacetum coccineum]
MPPSPPPTVLEPPLTFTTPIQPFNTSTDHRTSSTPTSYAGIKSRGNQAFSNITTIYLGNLSFNINPQIISNSFKKFGCIKGMSWRKQRSFAFINFSSCEQAQEAILRMHGRMLYGKHVSVYLAKTQLRSYDEEYQSENVSMVKPSKGFSLQPNSETTKVLSVSALIIDKEYMSQEKLSSWLERHEISIEKISQWGPHGTIVQCRDIEEYNRLLQSPSADTNGFLKIQSMTERENYYSRFI